MDGIQSDLAAKLLNSPDKEVAAAAKRIFFEAEPSDEQQSQVQTTASSGQHITNTISSSSLLINKFGRGIPSEIEEAAKAVVMMAPKQYHTNTPNEVSSNITVAATSEKKISTQLTSDKPIEQPSPSRQSRSLKSVKLPPLPPGKKVSSSDERLQRSRERNKMHARKTRQRKKEHMNHLETKAQSLKEHQITLKMLINEKYTANILLGMTGHFTDTQAGSSAVNPQVDELMKRSTDEIPDSTQIPDLPALILPGHHSKRRRLDSGSVSSNVQQEYPNDGIDYALLGKDRTSCTPEELDKIRKERNRMHAKRTRDRKRIFSEEMEKIIKQLEDENQVLENHLSEITTDSVASSTSSSGSDTPPLNSPAQKPACPTAKPPSEMLQNNSHSFSENQLENAPEKVLSENVLPSTTNVVSGASKPQHDCVKDTKDNSLALTVEASSAISTVSMSPTPHQNQDVSHDSSPVVSSAKEMQRKSSPEPLKLPTSITTTSETSPQ